MAKPPRSFLLERLRAQADAVAAKRVQQLELPREGVGRIDPRMRHVFPASIEFSCDTDFTVQGGATYNVTRIASGLRSALRSGFREWAHRGRAANVDRFEPVVPDFETPALDTTALDDLVSLMLAKSRELLLRAPLRGFVR